MHLTAPHELSIVFMYSLPISVFIIAEAVLFFIVRNYVGFVQMVQSQWSKEWLNGIGIWCCFLKALPTSIYMYISFTYLGKKNPFNLQQVLKNHWSRCQLCKSCLLAVYIYIVLPLRSTSPRSMASRSSTPATLMTCWRRSVWSPMAVGWNTSPTMDPWAAGRPCTPTKHHTLQCICVNQGSKHLK